MKFGWYARRLARMGPLEALLRTRDAILRSAWRARKVAPRASRAQDGRLWAPAFAGTLPPLDGSALSRIAVNRLLGSASALLEGEWQVFARKHPAFGKTPDWFIDARTGAPGRRKELNIQLNQLIDAILLVLSLWLA